MAIAILKDINAIKVIKNAKMALETRTGHIDLSDMRKGFDSVIYSLVCTNVFDDRVVTNELVTAMLVLEMLGRLNLLKA